MAARVLSRCRHGIVRFLERVAEPIMRRIAGDHLLRDPLDDLERVGFAIDRVERARPGFLERVWATRSRTP
jgi:hypothetical protein